MCGACDAWQELQHSVDDGQLEGEGVGEAGGLSGCEEALQHPHPSSVASDAEQLSRRQ